MSFAVLFPIEIHSVFMACFKAHLCVQPLIGNASSIRFQF